MLRRRWEGGNIRVDLRDLRYGDGRWIELAQNCVQWHAAVLVMLNF
jgi:hypothetical protein